MIMAVPGTLMGAATVFVTLIRHDDSTMAEKLNFNIPLLGIF